MRRALALGALLSLAALPSCAGEGEPLSLGSFKQAETCSCTGQDDSNATVTVNCDQTVCGSDHHTWTCTASGFTGPGAGCGDGYRCVGTDYTGASVTVEAGQSVCGAGQKT